MVSSSKQVVASTLVRAASTPGSVFVIAVDAIVVDTAHVVCCLHFAHLPKASTAHTPVAAVVAATMMPHAASASGSAGEAAARMLSGHECD